MPTFKGRFKGGTTAQWAAYDDPLYYREMGIEYTPDNRILFKFGVATEGDVGTPWSQLPYASGPVGPSPEFMWNDTSITFRRNDGTWSTPVNLVGPAPEYKWSGTRLQIKNPDGTWGAAVDLRGSEGPTGTSVPATSARIGGVMVGGGLSIDMDGVLSPVLATELAQGIGRSATAQEVTAGKTGAHGPAWVTPEQFFSRRYDLAEFYYFRHPILKPGFQPAQGGVLAGAATQYPEVWSYLQTVEGQLLCKTEAEWQAMTQATWATLADGTKIGWNGIGGAPFYVQDLGAGTLRLPDLRGMYAEAAGYDTLGVGGVHGDYVRNVLGSWAARQFESVSFASGSMYISGSKFDNSGVGAGTGTMYSLDLSRVVPTGSKNAPRAWGALGCIYLGAPAS